jgi:hypothetical protein
MLEELSKRLVNALTLAERLPKDEFDCPLTRHDREYILSIPKNTKHEDLIEWTANIIGEYEIKKLIANKSIYIGMTKADVRSLLGPPDAWGGTSRKYKEPCIWLYGKVEFFWGTKKYRTPYPGPKLYGVYVEDNNKDNGVMLLKDYP